MGNARNIAFWVVLFLLILALFNLFSGGQSTLQSNSRNYSDFVEAVETGNVSQVTLDGEEAAAHGDGVYIGRQQIGVVTSGTRSPTLARSIALARVAAEHAGPDTRVEVGKLDGQQKRLTATVVAMPHYDPERRRLKA